MNKYVIFFILVANIGFLQAQYTAIPDPAFEQELIDQGIDTEGVIDGQVLTIDIDFIIALTLSSEIFSLEGIEGFTSLEELYMNESLIYIIDLTQNNALRMLECSTHNLYELDLSQNINLEELNCSWGFISELDLTNCPNLTSIICEGNQISNLDLSNNPFLEVINCGVNPLTNLNISNTSNLVYLSINGTELTSLDISDNPLLVTLFTIDAELTSLDLYSNPLLENLNCGYNNIHTLNFENNQDLKYLHCSNNFITELNLDNNTQLEILHCSNNDLNTLSIQNGANELLTGTYTSGGNEIQRFNSLNNPILTCIFVDDAVYCGDNWVDYDPTSHFVETQTECDAIGINDYSFTNTVILYPNPVFDSFYIEENQPIEQVNIYSITGKLIKAFRNQEKYQVSDLVDGMYIIKIHFKDEIVQRKLIKR